MIEKPFDGKKLFTVEIEQTIVVMATDRKNAEAVATEAADGFDFTRDDAIYLADETAYLPCDWHSALPYGFEGGETCADIMTILEEYERTRPPTKAELEALGQQPLIPESEAA